MTKYEYETRLRQCWVVPEDEVLCDLSIKDCLSLEREQIEYEMSNMGDDHSHWVQRLKELLDYVM